jgi:Flp pilus assembly protein TadD
VLAELERMGRLEAAKVRYKQVLRLAPKSPDILLNFATLLGELDRHGEGLAIARKVLDRSPDMMRAQSLVTEFKSILKRNKSAPRNGKRAHSRPQITV